MGDSRRVAAVVLAVIGVLFGIYLLGNEWVRVSVVLVADGAGAVLVLRGVLRHRPPGPLPWLFLAGAQSLAVIADCLFYGGYLFDRAWDFPGPPDLFFLARYPLWFAVALLWVHRSTRHDAFRWRTDVTLVDVAIIVVASALLSWIFVISPLIRDSPDVALLVLYAAYPVGDLILLAVGMRIWFGGGQRSVSLGLLGGFATCWLAADTAYLLSLANGTYRFLGWTEPLWIAAAIALAAAATHPSMVSVGRPSADAPRSGTGRRLVLLGGVSLLAPAAQFVQYLRDGDLHVPVVTATCAVLFVLVMFRMGVLLREQRRIAITDTLTGLRTRRFFEENLALEAERAARFGSPMGVLLVDVDHFKTVNDRYGHKAGDTVLREVARRLRECARAGDVVARYGGEEFALLVAPTDRAGAARLGERLRDAVGGESFRLDDRTELLVTASIGVALLPDHAATPDELTVRADQCLYRAKNAGRNRVVVAGELPVTH
ncbi:GGDEF domain-containing protein [Cryptosporangium arvum]|uniref:GGDEF domain-containing protein n=1 Tax=Cryptosporangium arvum TaxID=80871 RepID=UPI0004B7C1FC|nr:GGDEF domain-containing protein [Cryptosporangium arvum]